MGANASVQKAAQEVCDTFSSCQLCHPGLNSALCKRKCHFTHSVMGSHTVVHVVCDGACKYVLEPCGQVTTVCVDYEMALIS